MKQVTIHNLEESTGQEVFDFIAHHLLTQNEKALHIEEDGEQNCKYRLKKEDGTVLRCAAGCLIPDEDYKDEIEGEKWVAAIEKMKITDKHNSIISGLQSIHDFQKVEVWERKLLDFVMGRNLNSDVVQNFGTND